MHSALYDRLRNTPVYRRLWISSFVVAVIPSIVICALLLLLFWNTSTDRTIAHSASLVTQAANYMRLQITQINNDITNFTAAPGTKEFLRQYAYMSRTERFLEMEALRSQVTDRFNNLHAVSDIVLVTNDLRNTIHIYGGEQSLTDADEKMGEMLSMLPEAQNATIYDAFYGIDGAGLIIAKRLVDTDRGTIIGYIILHMREVFLSSIYAEQEDGQSGLYILDGGQRILSTVGKAAVGTPFPAEALRGMQGDVGTVRSAPAPDGRYGLMTYRALAEAPFTLVSFVPEEYLTSDLTAVALTMLLVALLVILLASGIAFALMISITRPISELIDQMHMVQNDVLVVGERDWHTDEFATMNNTFNSTLGRLNESIQNIRHTEQEKTRLELKALTAQINPHFLTNTLGTVRALAQMQNARNIEAMVASLINILDARLGKAEGLVPLSEEAKLLGDYITLQKYRLFYEIAFEVDVADDARDCLIPVFTLQPLVENALRHGRLEQRGGGRIAVKAYRSQGNVHIYVTDNGAGMSPERLREVTALSERAGVTDADHIGIQNVNQRIKLIFGPKYGLSFESVENVLTQAEIIVPFTTRGGDGP